jgi:hypothetical protein
MVSYGHTTIDSTVVFFSLAPGRCDSASSASAICFAIGSAEFPVEAGSTSAPLDRPARRSERSPNDTAAGGCGVAEGAIADRHEFDQVVEIGRVGIDDHQLLVQFDDV